MVSTPVGKLLRTFVPPAMLAMSANAMFNICDILIVGRGIGLDAIAALTCTFPVIILVSAIIALVNTGSGSQIAVLFADNKQEKAIQVFCNSFMMVITTGLLVTAVFEVYIEDLLRLCGASDVTLPYALEYMRIMLVSNVILFTMQGLGRVLHILGKTKLQIMVQVGGITMNIILDAIFVFVFKWGMTGAALSSIICECVSLLIFVIIFSRNSLFVHFAKRGFRLDKTIIKDTVLFGVPPFATNVCGCVVAFMINISLIGVGGEHGDMYMGTYAIVQRITQVLVSIVAGLGLGVQIISNFNIAKQNYIRVRSVLMWAILYAFIIMCAGYGFITIFADQLISTFTTDPQMIAIGVPALIIGLCTFPFVGSQMIAVSFFQAIRKPRASMTISLTRQLLFLIPMLIILPHLIGVTGVWWSMALADVASVTISWVMLYTETKKLSL